MASPTCTALHDGGQACTSSATCKSGQCLPGTCSNGTNTCYRNTDCYGRCMTSGNFCTTDSNCGTGTCSNAPSTFCTSDITCMQGSGSAGTCVFPDHCVTGTCQGDIVCADQELVVDYCSQALGALPKPPTN
jgi:hypothetical protein